MWFYYTSLFTMLYCINWWLICIYITLFPLVRKVFEPCENLVWCDIIMHYTRFLLYCINWWRRYICIYITLPPLFRKVFEPCENLVYKFSWDKEIKLAQYVHKETIFNKEFSITKLSVYLSIRLFTYLSFCLSIYLSIYLSIFILPILRGILSSIQQF